MTMCSCYICSNIKRVFILAIVVLIFSGCTVVHEGGYHSTYVPPPWVFQKHHVTHDDHGHHNVNHHYTNRYGWTSHRPYYNPCNC